MSITTALLIAILVVFTLTLLFFIFLVAPIMRELHLILRDVRLTSNLVRRRIEKVNEVIEKTVTFFRAFGVVTKIFDRWLGPDDKDKKTN